MTLGANRQKGKTMDLSDMTMEQLRHEEDDARYNLRQANQLAVDDYHYEQANKMADWLMAVQAEIQNREQVP